VEFMLVIWGSFRAKHLTLLEVEKLVKLSFYRYRA